MPPHPPDAPASRGSGSARHSSGGAPRGSAGAFPRRYCWFYTAFVPPPNNSFLRHQSPARAAHRFTNLRSPASAASAPRGSGGALPASALMILMFTPITRNTFYLPLRPATACARPPTVLITLRSPASKAHGAWTRLTSPGDPTCGVPRRRTGFYRSHRLLLEQGRAEGEPVRPEGVVQRAAGRPPGAAPRRHAAKLV